MKLLIAAGIVTLTAAASVVTAATPVAADKPAAVLNFGHCISGLPKEARQEATPVPGVSGPGVFFVDPETGGLIDIRVPSRAFASFAGCGPDSS